MDTDNNNNIDKDMEMLIVDRLNDAFQKNAEYHQAVSKEMEIYNKLKEELPEQQQEMLEHYVVSASEAVSVCERIAYKQGARDLFHVLFQKTKTF